MVSIKNRLTFQYYKFPNYDNYDNNYKLLHQALKNTDKNSIKKQNALLEINKVLQQKCIHIKNLTKTEIINLLHKHNLELVIGKDSELILIEKEYLYNGYE